MGFFGSIVFALLRSIVRGVKGEEHMERGDESGRWEGEEVGGEMMRHDAEHP